eukprot:TRINITY_DN66880_c5_g10_i2.p1 TRINITY_DN66880_c5_g10~~TRINITY_DN66880_c5_g10_i2.p1  ORF type:complete len:500 (+),score=231.34 TRINITY_DN66880_c5_g10_i2:440-1939(+)
MLLPHPKTLANAADKVRRGRLGMAVVVQPDESVGTFRGEPVHAAINAAHLAQQVFGFRTVMVPAYRADLRTAFGSEDRFAEQLANRADLVVLEGGNPSVYDESTFRLLATKRDSYVRFCEELLLRQNVHSNAAVLSICLSHQCMAQALVNLLKRVHQDTRKSVFTQSSSLSFGGADDHATASQRRLGKGNGGVSTTSIAEERKVAVSSDSSDSDELSPEEVSMNDDDNNNQQGSFSTRPQRLASMSPFHILSDLTEVTGRIHEKGEALRVLNSNGEEIGRSYEHEQFAVRPNQDHELGVVNLHPYKPPTAPSGAYTQEMLDAHESVKTQGKGLLSEWTRLGHKVAVSMFHGDEVNDAAILFVNWALQEIRGVLDKHKDYFRSSRKFRWLMDLPYGVEVLCSTTFCEKNAASKHGKVLTEVAAMAIYYRDFDSNSQMSVFSTQFHPELPSSLMSLKREQLHGDDWMHILDRDDHDGIEVMHAIVQFMIDQQIECRQHKLH